MEQLMKLGLTRPAVTVFGSARLKEDHPHYTAAAYLGERLARKGIHVLSGGGPGIMEAANRGAHRANGDGKSYGITIRIPNENDGSCSEYHHESYSFKRFYARQATLISNGDAHVGFMGGIGTAFEILDTMTMMQIGFMPDRTILLYDTDYWAPMIEMVNHMVDHGTVDRQDIRFVQALDDVDEIADRLIQQLTGGKK